MTEWIQNIIVAGLGGQGVLRASDILAEAAFQAGYDVKKSEIHGMSQRGGSVHSDVRFGSEILSPMIPDGEADWLLVLDATQVEVNEYRLKPGGTVLGPDRLEGVELPHKKSLNVGMLGVLSKEFEIGEACWMDAIRQFFPEKLHETNEQAFSIGRG
jgi:indolepyruvate ferredoxin oxidoreductase beta subunit